MVGSAAMGTVAGAVSMGSSAEENNAGMAGMAARPAATGWGNEAWVSANATSAVDCEMPIAPIIGGLGLVVEAGRARG